VSASTESEISSLSSGSAICFRPWLAARPAANEDIPHDAEDRSPDLVWLSLSYGVYGHMKLSPAAASLIAATGLHMTA
jgi:hypothetical protein